MVSALEQARIERDAALEALRRAEAACVVEIHGMDACDLCGVPVRGGVSLHEADCPFSALADDEGANR